MFPRRGAQNERRARWPEGARVGLKALRHSAYALRPAYGGPFSFPPTRRPAANHPNLFLLGFMALFFLGPMISLRKGREGKGKRGKRRASEGREKGRKRNGRDRKGKERKGKEEGLERPGARI